MPLQDDAPKTTPLGKIFLLAFIAACSYGAYLLFSKGAGTGATPGDPSPSAATDTKPAAEGKTLTLRIAYGTEKTRWFKWAEEEFAKTKAGAGIKLDLVPKGSLEGARATVEGKEKIHVWSPASSAVKDYFLDAWQFERNTPSPIKREENLALTPMVFVFWKERHEAFVAKFKTVSFQTVGEALKSSSSWHEIAAKPEWGFFRFGHTDPNQSNSGLLTLLLYAHHYHKKTAALTMADVVSPDFVQWLKGFAPSVSGLSHSTGDMMKDMILRGPSTYDALFVYESVAIDFMENAKGRWGGGLQVAYPEYNIWSDNPYYIIAADWSGEPEQKAAGQFLDFLLSEPAQKKALEHGFRPAEPKVSLTEPDSPFTKYAGQGLRLEIPLVCDPPKADVIKQLPTAWQRVRTN